MLYFPHSPEVGLSNDPRVVVHRENDKDLGHSAEIVVAGQDSDPTSNVHPGELTFEEGTSRGPVFSAIHCFTDKLLMPDTAGGDGRHLGVFSCTMLMYAPSSFSFYTCFLSNLHPALVVLLAQVYSLPHRPSLDLLDLLVHPCYFGWRAFCSPSVGFLSGLNLVLCFRAPEAKRCTSKLYIAVQNTLQPLSLPRAPLSLVFRRAIVL